ncbi:MAG: hypothetical protein AB7E21_20380 [Pseudodonghicola sp.]|uniref:hypothetical protein n=1 Tax=Pseudodonghicola sp. TaxID=1969463 RepID=UPI003A9699F8
MKPMKLTTLAAVAAIMAPGMLWALTEADTDGDGMLNLAELQSVLPMITEADFAKMDANADGVLDADEIAMARGAGLLPANEG